MFAGQPVKRFVCFIKLRINFRNFAITFTFYVFRFTIRWYRLGIHIKFPTKTCFSLSKSKKARVIKMYPHFNQVKKTAGKLLIYLHIPFQESLYFIVRKLTF